MVMTFNKKMEACENFELFQVLALLMDQKYIHIYKMPTFEYFTGKPILCQLSPPSILLALSCKTEKKSSCMKPIVYISKSQRPLYRTNTISINIFPGPLVIC